MFSESQRVAAQESGSEPDSAGAAGMGSCDPAGQQQLWPALTHSAQARRRLQAGLAEQQ